jgi:hypothetical protein
MATIPPFQMEIYDKAFIRRGVIGDPLRVACTPRHNLVEGLDVTVASNHVRIDQLLTAGARLVCFYRGEQVFSGPIRYISGAGPWMAGQITITCESDKRLLWRMLGYPVPGAGLAGQNLKEDKRTGAAETVLKGYVSANLAGPSRWPAHQLITVAPDLARGDSITAAIGMQPLADVLIPLIDQAGIGFTVKQLPGNGAGLELDVYEPTIYPRPLSEDGRTVLSWQWSRSAPTATRAIIGGPEDDVTGLRPWIRYTDSIEGVYNDVIEIMHDAASEDSAADRLAAGTTAVKEAGQKDGFSVELAETDNFSYGGAGGVHVGDQVTIDIGGQTITDILREARINWDRENGFKATPTVGELTTPDGQLAQFITKIARSLRALKAR